MDENKRFIKFDEKAIEIIKSRVPKESQFPSVVLIDNTSCCNLKCSMCFHKSMQRKKGIMDLSLYKRIIDEIADNNLKAQIWMSFFGEGFILKDLDQRVKYAYDKGLRNLVLNTNGNLKTYDKSKAIIEAGLKTLYVGIDAYTMGVYQKVRVGGDLEKVKNNVLEYKNLLKEYGSKDQNIVVQFVEMDINKNELQDFIHFWHDEQGIECKIRPMVSWAGKAESSATNLIIDAQRLPCYWAMNTVNITDQGDVALCSVDLDCSCPMGNINNSSIREIWNTTLRQFRDLHRSGQWDKLPTMCKLCNDWQSGYAKIID